MIIAYDSRTGNVQRFIDKLNVEAIKIDEDLVLEENFILVTYTTGFGEIPPKTLNFLRNNHQLMVGVAASGNKNWGNNYCKSADTISALYNVPVLFKFELSGTEEDIENFKARVINSETYRVKQRSSNPWRRWFFPIGKR